MENVRLLCAEPRSQHPSVRAVFYSVLRTVQSAFNQLSNSNHAWATGEYPLTVGNNEEDYEIPVANFGKALSIITKDDSNQSHIERLIDFFEIQNIAQGWELPNDAGNWMINWDGSRHTAQRIAFFRKDGSDNVWVRIKPKPMQSCEYRIIYSIGSWADDAGLNDSPLLREHHHYFEVSSALNLLPSCSWWGDEALNQTRRKELATSLLKEESRYSVDWSRYIGNMRIDHITSRFVMGID